MSTPNATAASKAIQTITEFPTQLDAAARVIAGIPKGPWMISVSCTYGSSCCDHHASYGFATGLSSGMLTSVLSTAQTHAKTFFTAFTEIHSWLTSLPAFSQTFDTNAQKIVALVQSLPAGGKPNAAQQKELASWFGAIQSGLSAGKGQLVTGSEGVAQFLKAQVAIGSDLTQAENDLVKTAAAGLAALQEQINVQPCGKSEADGQFATAKAANDASVGRFQAEFGTLATQTSAANSAVGTVLGVVTGYEAEIMKISGTLTTASSGDLSNFLTQLDVQTATSLWKQLAAAAQTSLAANAGAMDKFAVAS